MTATTIGVCRRRVRRHEPGVDTELLGERVPDVLAEPVVPDLREDGGTPPEPRRRDGDVRRAAADRLLEPARLGEARVQLLGVQVDTDAADGQHVELLGHPSALNPSSSCVSASSSAPPAICRTSSSRVTAPLS